MTDRNQQTHFECLAGNNLQTVRVSRPSDFLVQSSWSQISLPPEGKWRTIMITVHNRMHFFFSVLATSSSIFDMLEGGNTLTGTSGSLFSFWEKGLKKLGCAKRVNAGAPETLQSVWIPCCLQTSVMGNRACHTAWISKLACCYELNSQKVDSCGQIWHL